MGMDLSGAGGEFHWSGSGWADVLEIAQAFGWIPTGTGPPRGTRKADWAGGPYFGNDGQRFYARDARALADALERVLATTKAEKSPARARHVTPNGGREDTLRVGPLPRAVRAALRRFGPEDIACLRQFIVFCRAGSFRIY